jgi:hypothetical protein
MRRFTIDPTKQNFNFASNLVPASAPIAPSVTFAGNNGFVFNRPAGGAFGSHGSFTHEELIDKKDSHLLALSNDAQWGHQWTDAGHDTGFGHPETTYPAIAHISASHSDFWFTS